jgi:hypothetical protein
MVRSSSEYPLTLYHKELIMNWQTVSKQRGKKWREDVKVTLQQHGLTINDATYKQEQELSNYIFIEEARSSSPSLSSKRVKEQQ